MMSQAEAMTFIKNVLMCAINKASLHKAKTALHTQIWQHAETKKGYCEGLTDNTCKASLFCGGIWQVFYTRL